MPLPGLLIIDGDANFHTVSSALRAAARQAAALQSPYPLTLVANTAWPYARRDRYADPLALPPAAVRRHERAGLLPGQAGLAAGSGLFTDRFHATGENEPGNGVLTAIEEFLLEHEGRLALVTLPLLHGLSLIYQRATPLPAATQAALAALHLGPAARQAAEATEAARLEQMAEVARLQSALAIARHHAEAATNALTRERAANTTPPPEPAPPPPEPATNELQRLKRGLRRAARKAIALATNQKRKTQAAEAAHETHQIETLRASQILDATWYNTQYNDVAETGTDPAEHYYRHGAAERRDPGPAFSTAFYLDTYPDVAEAGLNPVLHYLANGAAEGRDPSPDFYTDFYLATNRDVAEAGLNPLEHYLANGRSENRAPRG